MTSERGSPQPQGAGGGVPPLPLCVDLLAAHGFAPRVGLKKLGLDALSPDPVSSLPGRYLGSFCLFPCLQIGPLPSGWQACRWHFALMLAQPPAPHLQTMVPSWSS